MTVEELKLNVEKALDEIRPFLQSDGGDISLIELTDKEVTVQLEGNCVSCHINQMTLKSGVELTIKKYAPQIERVINREVGNARSYS
jgi:Fe-S cluster biogenesis protein NfuA